MYNACSVTTFLATCIRCSNFSGMYSIATTYGYGLDEKASHLKYKQSQQTFLARCSQVMAVPSCLWTKRDAQNNLVTCLKHGKFYSEFRKCCIWSYITCLHIPKSDTRWRLGVFNCKRNLKSIEDLAYIQMAKLAYKPY